jgi:hypothetical protein|tara:strand:- start:163 stop:402 length:240 start_codon:yes stop_codon:yes gene_type:complete
MNEKQKIDLIKKILIKIKPELKTKLHNSKNNLILDGLIDSFDIINILIELNLLSRKKINPNKINKDFFSNAKKISKLLD